MNESGTRKYKDPAGFKVRVEGHITKKTARNMNYLTDCSTHD